MFDKIKPFTPSNVVNISKATIHTVQSYQESKMKEGYEAGFAAGFKECMNLFENLKHDIFKANETLISKIIYRVVKMVTLREIKGDQEYTKRLITQLLDRLGTRENVKIYISPSECTSSKTFQESLGQSFSKLKNISVEIDHNIALGGCRIETDLGDIDATIETQLQSIAESLGVTTP